MIEGLDVMAGVAILAGAYVTCKRQSKAEEETVPECDCNEDMGPCEEHTETIVQRVGSSNRTADELCSQYVLDVMTEFDVDEIEEGDREFCERVEGWLDGEDDSWKLSDMVRQYEDKLPEGVFTHWDDGYVIYRLRGGPLADL